jgi:hypothetical protein
MLKRLQNAAIIALAACLLIGFGGAVWRASNSIHVVINQDLAKKKERPTDADSPKESAEEAIARYNKWLTIFTAILAVATVGLGFATVGLYLVSQRQLRHAEIEAQRGRVNRLRDIDRFRDEMDIARRSASAASDAAAASIRQAKIAEDTLTKLERPYVFIFGVRGIKQSAGSHDLFVEYSVANYGKMPAIIEAPHIGFDISDAADPPIPPRLWDSHSLISSPILQAGELRGNIRAYFPAGLVSDEILVSVETTRRFVTRDQPNRVINETTVHPAFNIVEGFDLFFRAVIRYRGPSTSGHETGAVWLYNPGTFEFALRGGEEHNYVK